MEPKKYGNKAPLWQDLLFLGLSCGASGLLMWWAIGLIDPNKDAKKTAKLKKKQLAKQLGRQVELDEFEGMVAADVINPRQINVTLDDVGGLDEIKNNLFNKVIAPMQRPDLFTGSQLLKPTKGVLLFGPPGTGKTMMAKAIAKESGANFINIRASSIQSKWFGDTSKLVTAVFTLAWKISPCIIFIDEVDAMLGRRTGQEHDAVTTMKTVFMQMWDGFVTHQDANVVVLAATNRPWDLDEAVLRRLPLAYEVGLPDEKQRENILLKGVRGEFEARGSQFVDKALAENREDPKHNGLRPLQCIAKQTQGYSGSDLMELCRLAAAIPIHEFMDLELANETESNEEQDPPQPRSMSFEDMVASVPASKPSILHAHNYKMSQNRSSPHSMPAASSVTSNTDPQALFATLMAFMNTMKAQKAASSNGESSHGGLPNGSASKDANALD